MFAKENMLRIVAKFIAYFSWRVSFLTKRGTFRRSYSIRVSFLPSTLFLELSITRFRVDRRSFRASAFYKKGPARGAKRGAYPSSSVEMGESFQAMRLHSIDLTFDLAKSRAEPICVAPTSSGLPGTAFRVPRAVGGYADPPVAHGVPYSEYI